MSVKFWPMDQDRPLISLQDVRTTAELARLLVSDAELEQLRGELSAVLAYAAELGEVDVTGVPPMTHAGALTCPLRADVVGPHDPLAGALRNAPATEGSFFSVPAILPAAGGAATTSDSPDDEGGPGVAMLHAGADAATRDSSDDEVGR